jgi:hypothetical protein
MHYSSLEGSDASKDRSIKANCPLVAWTDTPRDEIPVKVTQDNSDFIHLNTKPSDDDVKAIKFLYPWS